MPTLRPFLPEEEGRPAQKKNAGGNAIALLREHYTADFGKATTHQFYSGVEMLSKKLFRYASFEIISWNRS